jgi:hypothetical protein
MVVRSLFQLTRRAKARALSLLVAAMVLLVAGAATAAPAPMCDELGQSIAAPFPIFPSHNGEARSGLKPCEGKGRFSLGAAPAPGHDQPPTTWTDGSDRAPPKMGFSVARACGSQQPVATSRVRLVRPGFDSGVFRPPRAR